MQLVIREAGVEDAAGVSVLLGELDYPSTDEAARRHIQRFTAFRLVSGPPDLREQAQNQGCELVPGDSTGTPGRCRLLNKLPVVGDDLIGADSERNGEVDGTAGSQRRVGPG